jgi:hypothetical protein
MPYIGSDCKVSIEVSQIINNSLILELRKADKQIWKTEMVKKTSKHIR